MWKLALALSVCLPLAAAQTPPAPDATTGKAAPNVTVTEARPHINYQDSKAERKGPDKMQKWQATTCELQSPISCFCAVHWSW